MNTLPNELILLIFDNLSIPDKRVFIRISKIYNNITKQAMNKVKYMIFKSTRDSMGYIFHDYWCICDTLIDFKMRLVEYLDTQVTKDYAIVKRNNYYNYRRVIYKEEFVIEDTIINSLKI